MIDVYGLRPVNRTAALVVSQAGCSSGELTDEQMRENLVCQLKRLADDIIKLPKKSKQRKQLGSMKHELEIKINAIRPAKKAKGVEVFLIDVLREELTMVQFNILMAKAINRMNEAKMAIE